MKASHRSAAFASYSIRKSTRARSALTAVLVLSVLIACESPTEATPFLEGAYVRLVDLHDQAAEWTMELKSDESFSVYLTSGATGHATGTWSYDENRARLYFLNDPACGSHEGVYQYRISDDRLTLTTAFEPCTPRRTVLEGIWVRRLR